MNKRIEIWVKNGRRFGNGLSFEELSQIEENAYRSHTHESRTILRLAAALREAIQIEEGALAIILQRKAGRDKHLQH